MWLETDTSTNINITGSTQVGSYTSDGDRIILFDIEAEQLGTGSFDYTAYATKQRSGGNEVDVYPKTTMSKEINKTNIAGQSGLITVRNLDVVKVYLAGQPADTTTPDVVVRWFDDTPIQATTLGNTLDIAITGEVGIDLSNVKQATNPTTLTNITVPTTTSITNDVTVGTIDTDVIDAASIKADAVTKIQAGLSTITVADILAGVVEGVLTIQQALRLMLAVLTGKSDGGGTVTVHFRDTSDTKNRITAIIDANGNRSSVTRDGT